jgi:pteridine reductase
LVTGGAKRVGKAIVETLAAAGYDIAFTYQKSEADASKLLAALKRLGRKALAIHEDLTLPGAAANVVRHFSATFSRLDVLVNNASLYALSDLKLAQEDLLTRLWAIHVVTPMMLCKAFETPLRKSRGRVINMVDLLAERPWPRYMGYCASKAGLWNLTLGLARELAPEVTVNGIAPGVVEWPVDYPAADREKYLQRVPLARAGTPEDVAELVHFLCTGGDYITGQIIRLDGGRSVT